jgi:hypothetical protein
MMEKRCLGDPEKVDNLSPRRKVPKEKKDLQREFLNYE